MIKNKKDVVIQLIASAFLIMTMYLPSGSYIIRGLGVIIFNTVLFKYDIKYLLTKRNRKDVYLLVIAFVIFCVTVSLPNIRWSIRALGIAIFNGVLIRSLQYKANKKVTNDSR